MSRLGLTPRRRARISRGALSLGQAGLGALLVGGIVWAGTQPAVTERVEALSFVQAEADAQGPTSTTVALEQATLICPGPELVGLEGAREAVLETSGSVVSPPLEILGEVPKPAGQAGLELLAPTSAASEPAAADDPTTGVSSALTEATAYLALGYGSVAPGMVATQEVRAESEEVVGLASVPCQAAGSSSWVLGGGGDAGRAERLIISNPGSNPVTVDITAYGVEGTSSPANGQGIVVPAQGRVVLLGDGLVPGESAPAFRIEAIGGDVAAVMVETSIEGTRPLGMDTVAAAAEPAEEQVIAGVLVPAEGGGTVTLRVVNPGESEVIGTVTALTATGELPLPDAVLRAPAGSVVDVPLSGLPAGPTSLAVNADAPIVAAVRTQLTGSTFDAGWAVSQAPVAGGRAETEAADGSGDGSAGDSGGGSGDASAGDSGDDSAGGSGDDSAGGSGGDSAEGWAGGTAAVGGAGVAGASLPLREGIARSAVISARGAGATVQVTQLVGGEVSASEVLVPTDATVVVPLTGSGVWLQVSDGAGQVYAAVLSTNSAGAAAISSMPLIQPELSARRSEVIPLG